MHSHSAVALKEWAAVCAAILAGRQTILLRKGGLRDVGGEFRVEQPEFWLWPTNFHQDTEKLAPLSTDLFAATAAMRPAPGCIRLSGYARVEAAYSVTDESLAMALGEFHILAPDTVRQRFHYRTPGLNVLVVRGYRLDLPPEFEDRPEYTGCQSWVKLATAHPTEGCQPVLSDDEHARRLTALRACLGACGL